jgi:hypothetical protein
MPSHSTHINYYTRPACMGLGTLKITNFPIINRTAGLIKHDSDDKNLDTTKTTGTDFLVYLSVSKMLVC